MTRDELAEMHGKTDALERVNMRMRIFELENALRPFAALADEIETCAGPNGKPSDWSMACQWTDLVAARKALQNTPPTK